MQPVRLAPDSAQYLQLAANIRAHAAFSLDAAPPLTPTIRRAPLYPLFLALFGAVPRLAQCVLDALTAAMIAFLGGRRAWWAGVLYALHPGALFFINAILSESLFTFLMTATVALLVVAARRDDRRWAIAAGIAGALAILCRQAAGPILIVPALLVRRRRIAAAFGAAALIAIAPWIVRCSVLAGRFVFVSAANPFSFALATVPDRFNLNDQASIFRPQAYWNVDPCGRGVNLARTPREAADADAVCMHEALDNLRRYPGYYLRSRVSQLMHFPVTSFDFVTGSTMSVGAALAQRRWDVVATKLVLYAIFSLSPLLLGIAGTLCGARAMENRLASAVWICTFLVYAPGFVEYRYFFPAVPMLLVSAAFAVRRITSRT